jgi:hypothetical protein
MKAAPANTAWRRSLKVDPIPRLFQQADGFSKFLILTRLEGLASDHLLVAPLRATLIRDIIASQAPDGSWGGSVYRDFFTGTAKQLGRLGDLGLDFRHEGVARAVSYITQRQTPGGAIREDAAAVSPDMCRHHTLGNLCVSLDSLQALAAVGAGRALGAVVERLVGWIRRWQRPDGSWWSPGAAHREFRGVLGEPGCGLWLTCWAIDAMAELPLEAAREGVSAGAAYLRRRFGESPGRAWWQSPDDFMWCSVGVRLAEERMETVVTASVLGALTLAGCGRGVLEVDRGLERILSLQEDDGFWRAGHPGLDGWLTLRVLLALARLFEDGNGGSREPLNVEGDHPCPE